MSSLPTFDLDLLRTFVAVIDKGTFAAAGVQRGMSQSAVTQQMQRLEDLVGKPLFQKDGRRKNLTDGGRGFLRYARSMLALNDDAMAMLTRPNDAGLLRIGAPADISERLLPPILSRLANWLPGLLVEATIDRSPNLMEALDRGELDLVVSNRADAQLQSVVLRVSRSVWLCSQHYVHDPRQPVPLILGPEGSIFRRLAVNALDSRKIAWRTVMLCNSPVGLKAAVRGGTGILPRSLEAYGTELRELDERDGLPPLPSLSYRLCARPRSANPLAQQAFELLASDLKLPGDVGYSPAVVAGQPG